MTQEMIDDFTAQDEIRNESNLWDYKQEGNTLIGHVVSVNENGVYGREVTVDTGSEQKVVPTLTALTTKLKDVMVGDKVKIVTVGLVRSMNKKEYWDFQVFVKKTVNPKEVSSQIM
jgi:hypothetical protein